MEITEIDIQTLLPQRPPFLLVDRLLHFDMQKTVTEFEVRADNPLVRDGRLSEAGIMENIAQTCASRIGYINVYILKDIVRIGVIGSVKDLIINQMPPVGSRLVTTVDLVSEVFNITLVNAKVTCGEEVVASAQMKISLTDKISED